MDSNSPTHFAFCHINDGWSPRSIIIPHALIPTHDYLIKVVEFLRTHGPIIYQPNRRKPLDEKPPHRAWELIPIDDYLSRSFTSDEKIQLNTIIQWADASHNLYDHRTNQPFYEWVPKAVWQYGGAESCRYMRDLLMNSADIDGTPVNVTEVIIYTNVSPEKEVEFSGRFFWNFKEDTGSPSTPETMKIELQKMGFTDVVLAKPDTYPTSGYGFVKTTDETQLKNNNIVLSCGASVSFG